MGEGVSYSLRPPWLTFFLPGPLPAVNGSTLLASVVCQRLIVPSTVLSTSLREYTHLYSFVTFLVRMGLACLFQAAVTGFLSHVDNVPNFGEHSCSEASGDGTGSDGFLDICLAGLGGTDTCSESCPGPAIFTARLYLFSKDNTRQLDTSFTQKWVSPTSCWSGIAVTKRFSLIHKPLWFIKSDYYGEPRIARTAKVWRDKKSNYSSCKVSEGRVDSPSFKVYYKKTSSRC